jgi:hypothetical protein
MTANRWWVKVAARWLARVDGVSGQIRVFSLAVTAFSTFSLVLQNSGRGELVTPLGVVLAVGLPAYIYVYAEGGVWNQVSRDKQDMSTNYAGPTLRIDDEHIARGIIAGQKGEQLSEEEREAIKAELDETFAEYRDGIEL